MILKITRNMIVNSRKKKNIIWMKWKISEDAKNEDEKGNKQSSNKTMEVTSNEFSMA